MKTWREAAGILNPENNVRSIVAPCLVKKVEVCAATIAKTKLVNHMGMSLSAALASSSSLTLHIVTFAFE